MMYKNGSFLQTWTRSRVDGVLCRPLQVHAYIVSYLKKEMPSLFGREKKKEELLMRLPEIYTILQREHHISPGDFPNVSKMQVEEQTGSEVEGHREGRRDRAAVTFRVSRRTCCSTTTSASSPL